MYTFLSLKLHSNDVASVSAGLADKVQQAPGFFANTPVVVDLSHVESNPETDASALINVVREHKLVPVVISVNDKDNAVLANLDIPLVEAGKKSQTTQSTAAKQAASAKTDTRKIPEAALADGDDDPEPEIAEQRADAQGEPTSSVAQTDAALAVTEVEYVIKSPKLVNKPVRSGQQLYARDTDLVVIGPVGAGAEIVADSNIHVYGALRGRALCGVAGNAEARIFCQSLEAELVSVAGVYKVLEQIPDELRGRPAQIRSENDQLIIEPL